jgi:Carboxypeptidase regulatory-like domain
MRRPATRIAGLAILVLASLTLAAPPSEAADTPSLFGTIRDATTGAPIPGACVTVRQVTGLWELARVCTGTDGAYRLDGLSPTTYRVEVVADGFAPQWAPDEPNLRNSQSILVSGTVPTQLNLGLHDQFGTVRGRITNPEGRPAALATVYVKSTSTPWDANIATGVDGLFSLGGMPAGDYIVRLSHPELRSQYFDGKSAEADADVVTVPADGEVVVNDQFLERSAVAISLGTMRGTITDRVTGAPIAGARVTLLTPLLERVGEAVSDAAGEVGVADVPFNANFRAQVAAPGYALYWVGDSTQLIGAFNLNLVNGSSLLNSRLRRGPGTVRGQVTDPAGQPVRANMLLSLPGRTGALTYQTRLDGSFEFTNLPADTLSAGFVGPNLGNQAETFTIADGQVTTHNVQFKPRGTIVVTLLDSELLQPVPGACARTSLAVWHGSNQACTGSDGEATIAEVAPGTAGLTITRGAGVSVLDKFLQSVTVRSGETTRLTVILRSAGMIKATVQRAPDGTVPLACVRPIPTQMGRPFPQEGQATVFCNGETGSTTDTIAVGPLATGDYQLFVDTDFLYGVQWVGPAGGTGDRRKAALIPVRRGQTVTAPVIRLDRPGSISGIITDRLSGAPLAGNAAPFGITPGLEVACNSIPGPTACADSSGRYTMSRLGPYAWPVNFTAPDHAHQWSGGAANRFDAALVQVTAGQTTTLNAALGPEGRIINIRPGGTDPAGWFATAYNSVTGDVVSEAVWHNTPPVMDELNTESIFVLFHPVLTGQPAPTCWYGVPRRGFTPARYTIAVTAGQTIDGLDLTPGVNCGGLPRLPSPRTGRAFIDDATATVAPPALAGGPILPTWVHSPAWPTMVRLLRVLATRARQA